MYPCCLSLVSMFYVGEFNEVNTRIVLARCEVKSQPNLRGRMDVENVLFRYTVGRGCCSIKDRSASTLLFCLTGPTKNCLAAQFKAHLAKSELIRTCCYSTSPHYKHFYSHRDGDDDTPASYPGFICHLFFRRYHRCCW
jgi:hypothetical protein